MSVIRVLIVDDSQEWREFIAYLLLHDQRIEIVGEAADGTKALELAAQARPTLILLDVCMPGLNGLEAAQQIRTLEPNAHVIFVTGEFDHDVVSAALEIGASGYVSKVSANKDLPIAIDAAINGSRFVSDGLICDSAAEKASGEGAQENGFPKAANASPAKFDCLPAAIDAYGWDCKRCQ